MAGNFELQNLIGSGTFGEAWVARNKTDNSKCVVKIIKILKLSEKELDQALTEVSILARCKHINIIKYQDAFVDDGSLNIVMEYANGGDLHKRIVNQKGIHFGKEVILDWFVQMCSALKYIHAQNILHRDLKSQNVFLTSQNVVKIGDFGIARILRDSADCALTTIGTPFYLSPEICQKKPYNHKSDMWALGCVLYEMCTLHVPFNAKDFDSLVVKIMTGRFTPLPSHFGTTIHYLCTRLLDKDPNKRLSANETLNFSPLKTFVQRYEPSKRRIPQLSVRRDSSNSEDTSTRRNSTAAQSKKEVKNQERESKNPMEVVLKKNQGQPTRKQSDPLHRIQCQENFRRRPSVRPESSGAKKKGLDWMSDKENIDPRRLIGNKTYQVKYPKFRRFSSATPSIKRIVSQQRTSLSTEEQNKWKQKNEECARPDLYRNIKRQSGHVSVTDNKVHENEDSFDDEVFGEADFSQETFEECHKTVIENSKRNSIESSKRALDVKRRQSTEYFCNSVLNSSAEISADVNRRASVGKRESPKINRRVSTENSRRVSIEYSRRNQDEISTGHDQRGHNNNHKRDPVKIKRQSVIEKGNRKVSGSDGCLYVGNSLQESQRSIRRSSSYDAISAEKINSEKRDNIRKSGSETYLVSKPFISGSEESGTTLTDCTSSGQKEMIKYVNKALYMSLQDFMQSPATAKYKISKRLTDIFGEEKLADILDVCRECLYNHNNYSTFHTMLSETDVSCLPLIFQYLQLEGSQ